VSKISKSVKFYCSKPVQLKFLRNDNEGIVIVQVL